MTRSAKCCSRSTRSAKRCACNVSARSKRPRSCARSWPRSTWRCSRLIPIGACGWGIRAGKNLLGHPMDKLLGRNADDLGLAACYEVDEDEPLTLSFPGGSGRWGVRRSTFRAHGLPHELLVLTDLSRTLREEERRAWQRLVRVLGHEMNNSLAPIKSLAGSLETLLRRDPPPTDWQD